MKYENIKNCGEKMR